MFVVKLTIFNYRKVVNFIMIKKWYCGLSQIDTGEVGYTFYLDFQPANEFSLELDPGPWVPADLLAVKDQIFVSASLKAYWEIDLYFVAGRLSILKETLGRLQ
jgi:hypothetical protein